MGQKENLSDRYIDIHTHRTRVGEGVLAIRNYFPDGGPGPEPGEFFSFGLHPWHIREENLEEQLAAVATALESPLCLAVGECGLDRVATTAWDLQRRGFLAQAEMANLAAKPLLIHGVRSYPEIIAVKKAAKTGAAWIVHGFRGNLISAEQLLKNGFYLSFGTAGQAIMAALPSEKLFFETDEGNHSIEEVYERGAAVLKRSVPELKEIVAANFMKVFKYDS